MNRPLVIAALLLIASCKGDDECEQCDYTFEWTSDGQLTNTVRNCTEIVCDQNLCGRCVDIEYNRSNLPIAGTCYSCPDNYTPTCPAGFVRCEDYLGSRCADLQNDPLHCGNCVEACDENEECVSGDCVPRQL